MRPRTRVPAAGEQPRIRVRERTKRRPREPNKTRAVNGGKRIGEPPRPRLRRRTFEKTHSGAPAAVRHVRLTPHDLCGLGENSPSARRPDAKSVHFFKYERKILRQARSLVKPGSRRNPVSDRFFPRPKTPDASRRPTQSRPPENRFRRACPLFFRKIQPVAETWGNQASSQFQMPISR